ncbi:MAG: aromatic amino acid lyase [Deltaproteobacteria bacterium]|nr:aromatic amino acid lyase [Deltaproteobacteria bacterium]
MWVITLNSMARGCRGVRLETVKRIPASLEAGILGCVPSRGSVGASGDLVPSAHAVLTLLGEGYCTMPHNGTFKEIEARSPVYKRHQTLTDAAQGRVELD